MQTAKIEITKEGQVKLTEELQRLKEVERPLVVEKLHKARSMGDLAENSAYTTAWEGLSMTDGRIMEIEHILKNSVIAVSSMGSSVVTVGSTIRVTINGEADTIRVVGEYEADPMNKKLSATSPIGKALLGKKQGDIIEIVVPSGKITYNILEITS
ncbi:transcription elongation factor GreA [Candidatus Roizmanbacteria bacterium]|nr:transcription elongation factor GreA [Candidatus Roizmanbacteria bacterium]